MRLTELRPNEDAQAAKRTAFRLRRFHLDGLRRRCEASPIATVSRALFQFVLFAYANDAGGQQ